MERAPEGYELLEELGRGGMGVVHRALERATRREVALKLIPLDGLDVEARLRFQREAELAAGLRHPGIVTVFAAGQEPTRGWIAAELIAGARPLHEAWVDLPRSARVGLVIEAARALGHAHARGVVHRDVKGENVLVGGDGRVRVADFGLALRGDAERLTRTGALVGTPTAMAPEQVRGERAAIGPWTDVWALGALLYRALTDRAPFQGSHLAALLAEVARSAPRPPREVVASIPPALERECLRALSLDPRARHPDGEQLATALERALQGEPRGGPGVGGRALLGVSLLLLALAAGLSALLLSAPAASDAAPVGTVRSPGPPLATRQLEPAREPAPEPVAEAIGGARRARPAPPSLSPFVYDQGSSDLPTHARWRERVAQAERAGDGAAACEALRGCMHESGCVRCAEELAERLLSGSPEEYDEALVILRAAAAVGEPRATWRYACLAWAEGVEPPERVRTLARAAATHAWLCTKADGMNARQLYVEVLLQGVGGPVDLPLALSLLDEPMREPHGGLLRLQARAWGDGLRGAKDPQRAAELEQEARQARSDPVGLLRRLRRRAAVGRLALEWAPKIRAQDHLRSEEVQRILTEGTRLEEAHQERRAEALYRDGLERHGHVRLAGRLAGLLRQGDAGQQLEALAIYLAGAASGDPSHMWRYAELARALEAEEPPRLRAWVERAVKVAQPGEGYDAVVLARWLVEGYGGPPEPERARALLDRAVQAGSDRARQARGELFPDPAR